MEITDPVTSIKYISASYGEKLERLGIRTVKDLITHFPRKYVDTSEVQLITDLHAKLEPEGLYTIKARIVLFRNIYIRGKRSIQTVKVADDTGELEISFFNQPFLERVFIQGDLFFLSGRFTVKGTKKRYYASAYEKLSYERENTHLGRITPEYALTSGVTKKWFRNRIKSVVDLLTLGELAIPNETHTDNLQIHVARLHFPENFEELEESVKLLSEIELIDIHLRLLEQNSQKKIGTPPSITSSDLGDLTKEFLALIPFELTKDQLTVVRELESKLVQQVILNELLQGDVGSGKTVIMQYLGYVLAKNNLQTVILAPTTILAKQHFEGFEMLFKDIKITVSLVTSDNKDAGSADIMIGTTAVLARKQALLENVGAILIDEQHRFGVKQREDILEHLHINGESHTPHFMNVTATPIPRTITETFFSDIGVHIIKTKPKGRLPIKSHIVRHDKRAEAYGWITSQLEQGDQVYWVTPLIEDSESIAVKSATTMYEEVVKHFPEFNTALLHGKLKSAEKISIMKQFSQGEIDVLVSTTVIEVGVDIPNATIMVVENAERFGLAQLHQIRGRVGRGNKQSYFFMFYDLDASTEAQDRLAFMASESDGLEVATYDLKRRGPGEVFGTRQSGIPNLKIAKLNDLELLRSSKQKALEAYNKGVRMISLFRSTEDV